MHYSSNITTNSFWSLKVCYARFEGSNLKSRAAGTARLRQLARQSWAGPAGCGVIAATLEESSDLSQSQCSHVASWAYSWPFCGRSSPSGLLPEADSLGRAIAWTRERRRPLTQSKAAMQYHINSFCVIDIKNLRLTLWLLLHYIHYSLLLQNRYYPITTCNCLLTILLLINFCFIITQLLHTTVHYFKLL